MHGSKLVDHITKATGLPAELITDELNQLIAQRGLIKEQISLEEIRSIIAEYLQKILLEAKAELKASGLE